MKTADLTGALLDYWVARAMGYQTDIAKIKPGGDWCDIEIRKIRNVAPPDLTISGEDSACGIAMVPNAMREFPACVIGQKVGRGKHPYRSSWFYPSTVWDHGGPIIQREEIDVCSNGPGNWSAFMFNSDAHAESATIAAAGSTPLVAAMRAYVASKFGKVVEDRPATWGAVHPKGGA